MVCANRVRSCNPTIGFPHFNLTAANTSLQIRPGMDARAIHDMTGANREARPVPWALDQIAIKLAFSQATKMRTRFSKNQHLGTTADEQNRRSGMLGTSGFPSSRSDSESNGVNSSGSFSEAV